MQNSSSNASSVLGSLLSLGKSPSAGGQARPGARAHQQRSESSSFNETFAGVRQEAARNQPPVRRSTPERVEHTKPLSQPSSTERSTKPQSLRKENVNATPKTSREEQVAGRDNAAKAPMADQPAAEVEGPGHALEEKEDVAASGVVVSSVGEDVAKDLTLETGAMVSGEPPVELDAEFSAEVAEQGAATSGNLSEEISQVSIDTEVIHAQTVGETVSPGSAEQSALALDSADTAETTHPDTATLLASSTGANSAASNIAPVVPVVVAAPEQKVSLGSESTLTKAATAAVVDAEGDLNAAISGKSEEMAADGASKETLARLLASVPEAKAIVREPATAQSSPALEAVARAAEALAPSGRGFVVQSAVAPTVGSPQWSQAVGDRVLWLAAQNITSAEIRLDPPELGPMQVRVSVNQDQVQVTFTSPHAGVREALDQGATRLREMFNEQGLSLNVDVSDQQFSRRQEGDSSTGGRGNGGPDVAPDETLVAETAIVKQRLIDHYA